MIRLFSLPALALLLVLAAGGCAAPERAALPTSGASTSDVPTSDVSASNAPAPTHENLHSVLWTQTSVEYRATAEQAYLLARMMLDSALADPGWTASLEQAAAGGYEQLPPAVVLDVDETVLDNSAFQARLVVEDADFSSSRWNAWVEEARAVPVPGAVGFTQYAASRGVRVVYLTNRAGETEAATRRNLAAYGFPVSDEGDAVLTRGERPEWAAGEKEPRRLAVAGEYRILLLVGDNLGDFVSEAERSLDERDALVAPYDAYWGTRWIMLPNPQYGSWEGALFDFDYARSPAERRRSKYDRLDLDGAPLPPP